MTAATIKANCARCGAPRNCAIRGAYDERGGEDEFRWQTTWQILQCCGCDYTFVRTIKTNEEDYDYGYDQAGEEEIQYIERMSYWPSLLKRPHPDWMAEYGITELAITELDQPLVEIYRALNDDLYLLAGIGIRTAFDIASELLGIDSEKTFREKLDELVAAGRIRLTEREQLEILVDAGSASAHRGWRPKPDDLSTMMDILEHFIFEGFISPDRRQKLEAKAAKMKANVPARKKKAKP